MAELIPPKTLHAAEQLGMAGPFVLELLPGPEGITQDEAARVVRTIAVIAAAWDPPGALDKILQFTDARSPTVIAQLLEPWGRYGDYQTYARLVLAEVDFQGIQVDLQGADRVRHIRYLTTVTHLVLHSDLRDLSSLSELPQLLHLRLVRNTLVSLAQLVSCRTLRTLHLEQCSAFAEARPIDLSPLADLHLDDLIISGLLSKVDFATLSGVTLKGLQLSGTRREVASALPSDLNVESISMTWVPTAAEAAALRGLAGLRRLVLHDVAPDVTIPSLPGIQVEKFQSSGQPDGLNR